MHRIALPLTLFMCVSAGPLSTDHLLKHSQTLIIAAQYLRNIDPESNRAAADQFVQEVKELAPELSVGLPDPDNNWNEYLMATRSGLLKLQEAQFLAELTEIQTQYPTREDLKKTLHEVTGFDFLDLGGQWEYGELAEFYFVFRHLPEQMRRNNRARLFGKSSYKEILKLKLPPIPGPFKTRIGKTTIEDPTIRADIPLAICYNGTYNFGLHSAEFIAFYAPANYSPQRFSSTFGGLFGLPPANTLIHELGHAIDDELVSGHRSAFSQNSDWYQPNFTKVRSGKSFELKPTDDAIFPDDYGTSSVGEFWATSIEAYFEDPYYKCYDPYHHRIMEKKSGLPQFYPDLDCASPLAETIVRFKKIRSRGRRWTSQSEVNQDILQAVVNHSQSSLSRENEVISTELQIMEERMQKHLDVIRQYENDCRLYDQRLQNAYFNYKFKKAPDRVVNLSAGN